MKEVISNWLMGLQDDISNQLEAVENGKAFKEDIWQREGGGGGRTRVLEGGNVIERGGVNYSAVEGEVSLPMMRSLELADRFEEGMTFYATGVSLVIHPRNPMAPIVHMNVRYFELSDGTWWFGGGIDLTPIYVLEDDAKFFHHQLKNTCDTFDKDFHPEFKTWADNYFYIKHRSETRGIGGIFFDRINSKRGMDKEQCFEFIKAVGDTFCPTYLPILKKNKDLPYTEANKHWQSLRRGRYVEFNLVLDRGTKFGLDTNGRTESILMSMPPHAEWVYDFQPEAGSEEEKTISFLKKGILW
jgi:coproporphyrinogen III oxidase